MPTSLCTSKEILAERASLSGAEGGCQAETGAAAGMAAGAAVEMLGGTPSKAGHATALAQQGTLGLVCDPLGGLVELPCVFRNATGAAIALAAIEMAMAGITFAIPADEVIDTMGEIGKAMDVRYRETAGGGLAATPRGRRLEKARLDWSMSAASPPRHVRLLRHRSVHWMHAVKQHLSPGSEPGRRDAHRHHPRPRNSA